MTARGPVAPSAMPASHERAGGTPLPGAPRHLWLKAALFALLAGNTAAYAASGTWSEVVDAAAWLALLVLFTLETDFGARATRLVRALRLAAAAFVVAAAAGYVRDAEWLDAVNSALWIAIVVVLEVQVRAPRLALRLRPLFAAATAAIYAGLGAIVIAWLWRAEWFDAYDALLWLAALIVIEMNVLARLHRSRSDAPAR